MCEKEFGVRVGTLEILRYTKDAFLSNMYLLITEQSEREKSAIVIDPNRSETAKNRLNQLGIEHLLILLTHEHFDHTSGVNWLREAFSCHLLCSEICGGKIAKVRNNRPLSMMAMGAPDYQEYLPYVCKADAVFSGEYRGNWSGLPFVLCATPGHTAGSCCIEIGACVFTGDSMLLDLPTITRFPGGSQEQYERITLPYLKNTADSAVIFPGHNEPFRKIDAQFCNGHFVQRRGNSESECENGADR